MSMTAIIGALVALLPQAPPKPTLESEIARLRLENMNLARSHARLVDHIEALEREILAEQHISTHWEAEAARLARQSREAREARERREQINGRNALAFAQFAQQNAILAQQSIQAQQNAQQQFQDGSFCNCVPSRAQVWTEEQRRNLAAVGDRIARNRP